MHFKFGKYSINWTKDIACYISDMELQTDKERDRQTIQTIYASRVFRGANETFQELADLEYLLHISTKNQSYLSWRRWRLKRWWQERGALVWHHRRSWPWSRLTLCRTHSHSRVCQNAEKTWTIYNNIQNVLPPSRCKYEHDLNNIDF